LISRSNKLKIAMALMALAIALWLNCGKDKPTNPQNRAPVITSITAEPDTFAMESSSTITVTASDPDGDGLNYSWESRGELLPIGNESNTLRVTNCCPVSEPTLAMVISIVDDGRGGSARDSVPVWILPLR
jgi:hypothetical protein